MIAVWIDADIQALITGIIKYLKLNTEKKIEQNQRKNYLLIMLKLQQIDIF